MTGKKRLSKKRVMRNVRPVRATRQEMKRVPPGSPQLKLSVQGCDENKRQYWALPRMFDELTAGGYTFVKKKGVDIGTTKDGNTDLGSLVSVSAGGDGDKLYLMEIDKQLYQENEDYKQSFIDELEDQINYPQETDISYAHDQRTGRSLSSIRHE